MCRHLQLQFKLTNISPVFVEPVGHITTETASGLIAFVAQQAYSISRVLETHVHADHLSVRSSISSQAPAPFVAVEC